MKIRVLNIIPVFIFFLIFIFIPNISYAFKVDKVVVEGNKRIPVERISQHFLKTGSEFSMQALDESIKKLYSTGLFFKIDSDLYVDGDKFTIKYIVKEMPLVGSVIFSGNKEIKDKKLREKLLLKTGQVLSFKLIEDAIDGIRALYEEENRYGTKITFQMEDRTVNSVDLIFNIDESDKSKIYNIFIYGNEHISTDEIKSVIPTKEREFWSLLTGSGTISKEAMAADVEFIRQLYMSKGYAKVAVSEPDLQFNQDDPSKANLIIRIQENNQYYVRSVEVDGNENIDNEKIEKVILLKPTEIFNIRKYQEDIANITEIYTSSGYAYANVEPIVNLDDETKEVDIVYKIEEGNPVKVGRINITGNKTSHDNIIRRQIDQMEGELYNSTLIKEAKANAMATGFFEDVQISETANGDKIDINIDVVEQRTGSFTVGAAYSTVDGFLGMVEVARSNFLGWGHDVSLKAELAQKRMDFSLSYTDPWFMDWPVSVGADLYSYENDWYDYTRRAVGGSLRIGHSIIKRRLHMNYTFSIYNVKIFDIDTYASRYVKEQEGTTQTHSISPAIIWNNLDNPIDPAKGNKSQFFVEFAGNFLGGDAHYLELGLETSQFFPVWRDNLVLMLHGEIGYIMPTKSGAKIPIDKRYRLGGINTIRGFDFGSIGPRDADGFEYGGDKYFQVNVELIFPIKKDINLKGVVFFDMGQAYNEDEHFFDTDFRKSAGIGIRWLTPMGPFRLEWGYKLDKRKDEDPYKFEFSIGGTF